jgi:hypothetical protein
MGRRAFYTTLGVIGALVVAVVVIGIYSAWAAKREAAARRYAASIQGEVTKLALADTITLSGTPPTT